MSGHLACVCTGCLPTEIACSVQPGSLLASDPPAAVGSSHLLRCKARASLSSWVLTSTALPAVLGKERPADGDETSEVHKMTVSMALSGMCQHLFDRKEAGLSGAIHAAMTCCQTGLALLTAKGVRGLASMSDQLMRLV